MEDKDFKSMMSEHEAGKARGPPSGSHFAKMQNASIWGVKPNFMGEGKDWVMPENIPEAKENNEHVEKADDIKETKDAESTDAGAQKPVSPLTGEGNLTKSADGTVPFKDIMVEKTFHPVDIPSNGTPEGAVGAYKQHKLDNADYARADKAKESRIKTARSSPDDVSTDDYGSREIDDEDYEDESDSTDEDEDGDEISETVTRKSAFGTELRPFKDIMKER